MIDLGPLSKADGAVVDEHSGMTHGYERMVERRIRLWVVQQERNRRRVRAERGKAQGATPGGSARRAIDVRQR